MNIDIYIYIYTYIHTYMYIYPQASSGMLMSARFMFLNARWILLFEPAFICCWTRVCFRCWARALVVCVNARFCLSARVFVAERALFCCRARVFICVGRARYCFRTRVFVCCWTRAFDIVLNARAFCCCWMRRPRRRCLAPVLACVFFGVGLSRLRFRASRSCLELASARP